MMEDGKKYSWEDAAGKNPFKVPEGYFDTLYNQILEQKSAQTVQPRRSFNWGWVVAPAVLLVLVMLLKPFEKGTAENYTLSAISDEELMTTAETFDENTVTDYLAELNDENISTDELSLEEEELIDELITEEP